jgi:hypothetical protein
MLTGVAGRLFDEAFKGFRLTVALGWWGWGLRCRRTYGGGVTWPHPLEHDAQPYECDQRELVEEQRRDHGTTPSYTCCNESIVPGLSGCGISRRLRVHDLRIEHVNSSVKRCRIVKDRMRLWKAGVRDLVMEICCALHNFRVRLNPWLPMI